MVVNTSITGNWDRAKQRLFNGLIILALGIELYFLIYDIPVFTHPFNFTHSNSISLTPVAELISSTNSVHVQNFESLVWENTHPNQTLYRKQSVLTLADSKAEIAFLDGTGIAMDENSLIELEKYPADSQDYKKIVIRLVKGTLRKTQPKKRSEILRKDQETTPLLLVQTDTFSTVLTPESEVTISKQTVSSIEIQAGALEVQTPKGLLQIKEGFRVEIPSDVDQTPILTEKKVLFLFPNTEPPLSVENETIFRWKISDPSFATFDQEIEIAQDTDFKKIKQKTKIHFSGKQQIYEKSLPLDKLKSGTYFWRIKGSPEFQKFSITHPQTKTKEALPPPPQLQNPKFDLNPKKNKKNEKSWLDYFIPSAIADEKPYYQIYLKWDQVEGVTRYKIQISKQRNFKSVLFETETLIPEYVWEYQVGMENSKGRVFYRVASVSSSGLTGRYSDAQIIEIPKSVLAGDFPKQDKKTTRTSSTAILEPASLSHSDFSIRIDTGIGNLKQNSSETNLSSVSIQSPFWQQKIALSYLYTEWNFNFALGLAKFKKPDSTPTTLQPDVIAYDAELSALKWANSSSSISSEWKIGYGGVAERDFRWVKTDSQVVDPQGAFSLGPTAAAVRNYKMMAFGLSLRAPITGLFTSGQAGIKGSVYGEWKLFKFEKDWIGLQLTAESSYLFWKTPAGTNLFNWTVWLGPSFHFSSFSQL